MAGVTALLVLLLVAAVPAYAKDYTVGDSQGWTSGVDYNTWASDKTFQVGDSLVFQYSALHTVNEVGESDYKACSSSNSMQSYNDQNTKITLAKAGSRYFICGTPGHCSGGMKLAVTVGASSPAPTASPSTPSTPEGSTPSGTGTPSTPTNEPTTKSPSSTKSTTSSSGTVSSSFSMVLLGSLVVVGIGLVMG